MSQSFPNLHVLQEVLNGTKLHCPNGLASGFHYILSSVITGSFSGLMWLWYHTRWIRCLAQSCVCVLPLLVTCWWTCNSPTGKDKCLFAV